MRQLVLMDRACDEIPQLFCCFEAAPEVALLPALDFGDELGLLGIARDAFLNEGQHGFRVTRFQKFLMRWRDAGGPLYRSVVLSEDQDYQVG